MTDPLTHLEAERSVLGAVLLDEQHLTVLTVDEHLQPDHFSDPRHRAVFRAMLELQTAGRPIDYLTVAAHLTETGALIDGLCGDTIAELVAWVPATGHAGEYGRLVRERHQARQLLAAGQRIQASVNARTAPIGELVETAAAAIDEIARGGAHGRQQHTWTPGQLRDWMLDDLAAPGGEDVLRTPFPILDDLLGGGLGRGEQMLIGGDEGLGKSHLVDDFLEQLADTGLRANLYVNEGGKKLRLRRFITRHTGIPGRALKARDLTAEQMRRAVDALKDLKVGITDCTGWTAPEIVRDIKRHQWDAFAVDIAHNIPKVEAGVEGWDTMAAQLRTAPVQADGVMLLAVHTRKRGSALNEPPVQEDIRDSKMFAALADSVLLLHRDREDQVLTNDGMLILSKARDGETGKLKVTFNSTRLRFMPGLAAVPHGVRGDQYRPHPDSRIESSGEFAAGF